MLNYAIELNIIAVNPVRHQKQQAVDNKRTRYLTNEKMSRLLKAGRANSNPYLYYILQMALMTGMGMSEIISLKPSDIYLDQRYMIISQTNTKNKKQRFVPINDILFDCLQEYYAKFTPQKDEKLFKVSNIHHAFYRAVKAAKLENFRFHDMRHTFGSHLAQKKVDLYAVSELLGHSNITATQRYAHLNKEHLMNAVNTLTIA